MLKAKIDEKVLKESAAVSAAAFFDAVAGAVENAAGGILTPSVMARMSADQITLLAYKTLREEVSEGGFIQLIHNGYGAFIFVNPFEKAVKGWGMADLARLLSRARKPYARYHARIEEDMSDAEFMALYESMPEFDALDDEFVEREEMFTAVAACYVDDHLDRFVEI